MDVHADVVVLGEKRRPGMYTNSNADRSLGQPFREGGGGRQRSLGGREDNEEGIPFGVDLDPTPGSTGGSDHMAVIGERLRVCLGAQLLEQPGRARDVGEEEGDRSTRQLGIAITSDRTRP
jgi:hypothetical protein